MSYTIFRPTFATIERDARERLGATISYGPTGETIATFGLGQKRNEFVAWLRQLGFHYCQISSVCVAYSAAPAATYGHALDTFHTISKSIGVDGYV